MKELFRNIIDAPAATMAGAITAALAVVIGADLGLPTAVVVGLMSVSAFLSIFSGPNKPTP